MAYFLELAGKRCGNTINMAAFVVLLVVDSTITAVSRVCRAESLVDGGVPHHDSG
jgi:hypothetical protein